MGKKIEAHIKPELLIWARKSAGYNLKEVEKKFSKITQWENGESLPSISQLRKLASLYKRPLAVFYLSEPPKEFDALHDYRLIWGEEKKVLTPALRLEIRRSKYRRENILNIFQLNNEPVPSLKISASFGEDEELLANKIRENIGVSLSEQIKWKGPYVAFNTWRNAISELGILVFQSVDIEETEMRGFSIIENELPIVVVNNKDAIRGRIFTLMHELAHIALDRGGLCNLREKGTSTTDEQKFEIYCNHVAGSILVPKEALLTEELVKSKISNSIWEDSEILFLSNRFMVSRETLLRRLLILGKTSSAFYEEKRAEYLTNYKKQKTGQASHPMYHVVALSKTGHYYARLVLTSYYQQRITASEVSDFLGMKLKHLPKIEAEVFGDSHI